MDLIEKPKRGRPPGLRTRPLLKHQQLDVRDKIKVGMIVDRLQKHIDGTSEMSSTQIQAATVLLRKCVPDLSASEIKAEVAVGLINIVK